MPLFTIIIPFHNAASTLGATLKSLQAQSHTDWEAICVNDRSTDASPAIARRFAASDARLRVIDSEGNGPSEARNCAARQARGTYLAFLDADDLWTANKLTSLAEAFETGDADALYSRIGFFNETPADCETLSQVLPRPLVISDLLAENPVCTLSNLAVTRAAFCKLGGFDASIVHNEDLDFLIRLIGEDHTVRGLDMLLTWYRTSPTGLSADMRAMLEGRRRVIDTAFRYGVSPTRADDAVYMRYLARRALRLRAPYKDAWAYAREGLRLDPKRFLTPLRRGAGTALAAALVRCLPSAARLIRN